MWKSLPFIFLVTIVHAQSIETKFLRQLKAAKSVTEINSLTVHFEASKIAALACKIQIRERRVPKECYHLLKLESEPKDPRRKLQRAEQVQKLDGLCSRAAGKLKVDYGPAPHVSRFCAKKIREAQEIQNYRANEEVNWSQN